jgi:hypothetical protein
LSLTALALAALGLNICFDAIKFNLMIPLYNHPVFSKATGNVKNFCCIYIGIGLYTIFYLQISYGNDFLFPHPPFVFRILVKGFAFSLVFVARGQAFAFVLCHV